MKICIFGASSDSIASEYIENAFRLGKVIGENGHELIFGAGNTGLMGACARGLHSVGGKSVGIAPKFFDEPGVLFPQCSRMIFTETMSERKKLMEDMCDAFIVLPGGIGTFEEFFEVLTLKQLGRHNKPIVLLDTSDYFSPVIALLTSTAEKGFMSRSCLSLFTVCSDTQKAVEYCSLRSAPSPAAQDIRSYNK